MSSQVSKLVTSSDGSKIFAQGIGNPDGPTLVLIHGWTLSAVVFNNLFDDDKLLSKVYLVRYDLRGHGMSDKPQENSGYSSKNYAADFTAVVEEFQRKKPYLLGWSIGATVAADVCAHRPGYLSGIVYIAAVPYIGPIMKNLPKAFLSELRPRLLASHDGNGSLQARIDFVDSALNECNMSNWELRLLWLGAACRTTAHSLAITLSREQDPQPLLDAGSEGLKLLMLYGDSDKQLNNETIAEEIGPQFSNKKVVVVKGGSHALCYDHQDQVVEELVKFVI